MSSFTTINAMEYLHDSVVSDGLVMASYNKHHAFFRMQLDESGKHVIHTSNGQQDAHINLELRWMEMLSIPIQGSILALAREHCTDYYEVVDISGHTMKTQPYMIYSQTSHPEGPQNLTFYEFVSLSSWDIADENEMKFLKTRREPYRYQDGDVVMDNMNEQLLEWSDIPESDRTMARYSLVCLKEHRFDQ